jgi:hypothetical protein
MVLRSGARSTPSQDGQATGIAKPLRRRRLDFRGGHRLHGALRYPHFRIDAVELAQNGRISSEYERFAVAWPSLTEINDPPATSLNIPLVE